jgi:hypothetical protein
MTNALRIGIAILTPLLVVVGTLRPEHTASVMYISGQGSGVFASSRSPEAVIESMMENIKTHRYHDAYALVANINQVDEKDFLVDTRGTLGDLRSFSGLEDFEYHVLRKNDSEAVVRTTMRWATAVGEEYVTRDLKLVNRGGGWKVIWPEVKEAKVSPQVVLVNYSAWSVIWHGERGQQAAPPQVRVTKMKATSHGNTTVVVGEITNEDSVPASVFVEGSLIGGEGKVLSTEGPLDKMLHVLLPKQSSPFRLDFPGIRLEEVKKVRMQPESALVSASTDPMVSVSDQHMDVDARGRHILAGELLNDSGQLVNIPHVIGAFYDSAGQVVWVSHGYVDRPLLPQGKVSFTMEVPDDIAPQVQTYKVAVNQFTTNLY